MCKGSAGKAGLPCHKSAGAAQVKDDSPARRCSINGALRWTFIRSLHRRIMYLEDFLVYMFVVLAKD